MNLIFPYIRQLQIISDCDASLIQLLLWFEQFKPLMPASIWMQAQTALVEGFTNAVRHAHRNLASDTPIDVEVQLNPGVIELRIWDWGSKFDLMAFMKTLPTELDMEAESGRGLKLMIKIVDQLEYVRLDNQQNCLHMVKHWKL